MSRRPLFRLLATLALCTLPHVAAARTSSANWVTLLNCQLRPNPANDGDSFHVMANGRECIFRLYLVDAPETDNSFPERVAEQASYFHISSQNALRVGQMAKQFSAAKLGIPFTVITHWDDAMGRSHLPRFYAFIRANGRDLGENLVENGLARIYGARTRLPDGTTAAAEKAKLRNLEGQAKAFRRAAWAYSSNFPAEPPRTKSTRSSTTPASPTTKAKEPSVSNATGSDGTKTSQYRISASGIRHNSSCRYFNGATTKPCGPTDGRPCKICGG